MADVISSLADARGDPGRVGPILSDPLARESDSVDCAGLEKKKVLVRDIVDKELTLRIGIELERAMESAVSDFLQLCEDAKVTAVIFPAVRADPRVQRELEKCGHTFGDDHRLLVRQIVLSWFSVGANAWIVLRWSRPPARPPARPIFTYVRIYT